MLRAMEEEQDLLDFSNYTMQLKPYVDTFGLENIFAVTFERLLHDTKNVLLEIYEWLNLQTHSAKAKFPAANVRGNKITKIRGKGILHKIRHSSKFGFLTPYVPKKLKGLIEKLTIENVHIDEKEIDTTRIFLIERQKNQIRDLEELLNRRFTEWKEFY
jgi:hypothetical protein